MNTIKNIATKAYSSSATVLWGCGLAAVLLLTGCSALPAPPARPVLYDFGPGPLATVPTDRRAPLPPLAMADMDAPGLPEGERRAVPPGLCRRPAAAPLQPGPLEPAACTAAAAAPARATGPAPRRAQGRRRRRPGPRARPGQQVAPGAAHRAGGVQPPVHQSQRQRRGGAPARHGGRADPGGRMLRGQRVFIVQQPAKSADAAGGVAALAAASGQLASELAAWVEQVGQ